MTFTICGFMILIKDKEGGELRDKQYVKNKDELKKKIEKSSNKSKSQFVKHSLYNMHDQNKIEISTLKLTSD